MGRALIAALCRSGVNASSITLGEPNSLTRAALEKDFGVCTSADNTALIADSQVLVLCVKPQDMAAVLHPLQTALAKATPLIISVAAGLSVADLTTLCGSDLPIVRAMPNRPALLGAGATGLFANPGLSPQLRARATALLATAGSTIWVEDENQMNVVTAISGSGPAYFFLFAEALAKAGQAQGLSLAIATELAAATLHGAGAMVAQERDLSALRIAVASPGGTTEAALKSFEKSGFDAIVATAVQAAVTRSNELSTQFGS